MSDPFQAAQNHIPGGVNSPVRAFAGVGGDPVFIKRAQGAYIFGEDAGDGTGRQYIDYVGSWGPMILAMRTPTLSRRFAKRRVTALALARRRY